MQKNSIQRKTVFSLISLILILLYFTGCTQPIQEAPGTAGEKDGFSINFNYSMTGAFDRAVTRASELNRAKMYITNLETGKTETKDWIVLIDKETMEATSYSSVALNMGKYSFELVVSRGSYNYYAKSGPIELKNGANSIPLKLTPVIGDFISDTATVTDLSCIGNLVYKFSTVQLAMVNDPRLGYSINGSEEIIIKLNKTTGLAPVKVCLPDGTYPIELKFYDGTTLLGTNLKKKEIYISAAFTTSTIDLYPLYGDCSFDISSGTGEAKFSLELSCELARTLRDRHYGRKMSDFKAKITVQYADRAVTGEIPFVWNKSTQDYSATGVIKGVTYGRANIIIDLIGLLYPDRIYDPIIQTPAGRSINENVLIGEAGTKLDIVYRLYSPNLVESSLKSIVNLSMFTAEGYPIFDDDQDNRKYYFFYADGKYIEQSDIKVRKGSCLITLESDTKVLEVSSGAQKQRFELSLTPLETKNINYTFPASSQWINIKEDDFYKGLPQPFTRTIKLGSKLLRVRYSGEEGSRKLSLDMLNSSGTGWEKAAPDYPLEKYESYRHSYKGWTIDSKGRLYLSIYSLNFPNRHKVIRLSEDMSRWKLLTSGIDAKTENIFADKAGNIFTFITNEGSYSNFNNYIKKLKSDDSGWEDYKLPPLPVPSATSDPNISSDVVDCFADSSGNIYAVANHSNFMDMNYFFFKYNPAAAKWDLLFNIDSPYGNGPRSIGYTIDELNNIYYSHSYWGTYSHYYSNPGKAFAGKYDSRSGQLYNLQLKGVKHLSQRSFNVKGHKGSCYINSSNHSFGFKPYVAKINAGSQTIDESLAVDTPVIPDGFRALMAIAADGTPFLCYYNGQTGQSYYYRKR